MIMGASCAYHDVPKKKLIVEMSLILPVNLLKSEAEVFFFDCFGTAQLEKNLASMIPIYYSLSIPGLNVFLSFYMLLMKILV